MADKELAVSQKAEMIEQVVNECNLTVIEQMPKLARGLALGKGLKRLRELVDDDVMSEAVLPLMESPLGFRTDRDGKDKGYPKAVIKDAVIHALLRGGQLVGNEFNVISGKCYLTKEYYERQVRELVHNLRVIEHVPQVMQGGALVGMEASWIYEGKPDRLKCVKSEEGDARIAVRVNAGMGIDAILGKAYRKLYARIYRRVTGSMWMEAEAEATEVLNESPDPLARLHERLGEFTSVTTVNSIQCEYEARLDDEDTITALVGICDARRDAIRAERGERANQHEAVASEQ